MFSEAIKQQVLEAIVVAMNASHIQAYRGALVGIKQIQSLTQMPNELLAVGLIHGVLTGVLSTHRHDHIGTAKAENMVHIAAWGDAHYAYYCCGVAIRS